MSISLYVLYIAIDILVVDVFLKKLIKGIAQ
jgi:hypothetical protein